MYSCGLVLEGGGSRGIYTGGVLDAFIENGIGFPYVIGVSMGSCCGASFIGKCKKRQHDVILFSAKDIPKILREDLFLYNLLVFHQN